VILVSDEIRKFTLEKWFSVSSLEKRKRAGIELKKPALCELYIKVPFLTRCI
jgi:hypothetical protein